MCIMMYRAASGEHRSESEVEVEVEVEQWSCPQLNQNKELKDASVEELHSSLWAHHFKWHLFPFMCVWERGGFEIEIYERQQSAGG